jgi:hypothetical protein
MLDGRGTSFFGPWPGSPRNRFLKTTRHASFLSKLFEQFLPCGRGEETKIAGFYTKFTRKIISFSNFCCTQFLLYCTLREFLFDRKLCTSVEIVESVLRSSVRDCINIERPVVHPAYPRC